MKLSSVVIEYLVGVIAGMILIVQIGLLFLKPSVAKQVEFPCMLDPTQLAMLCHPSIKEFHKQYSFCDANPPTSAGYSEWRNRIVQEQYSESQVIWRGSMATCIVLILVFYCVYCWYNPIETNKPDETKPQPV
jgi:hypothetical protein